MKIHHIGNIITGIVCNITTIPRALWCRRPKAHSNFCPLKRNRLSRGYTRALYIIIIYQVLRQRCIIYYNLPPIPVLYIICTCICIMICSIISYRTRIATQFPQKKIPNLSDKCYCHVRQTTRKIIIMENIYRSRQTQYIQCIVIRRSFCILYIITVAVDRDIRRW